MSYNQNPLESTGSDYFEGRVTYNSHHLWHHLPLAVMKFASYELISPSPLLRNVYKTITIDINHTIRSIGLRLWYINITITILDIIHRLVFFLKHLISEAGFCLCLHVVPRQRLANSFYWARLSRFHLKTETESSP
jgi:hypothetical protein